MTDAQQTTSPYYDAPYKPSQSIDAARAQANALEYIAEHMRRLSVSMKEVVDRLERIETALLREGAQKGEASNI